MTETETKIVQLLKSDEDCNKILGLILGRNELGVEGLLDLIHKKVRKRYNTNICEIQINQKHNKYIYTIYLNTFWHRLYIKYRSQYNDLENLDKFKIFLKLTIDDNI